MRYIGRRAEGCRICQPATQLVAVGDFALVTYARAVGVGGRLLAVIGCVLASSLAMGGIALADDGPQLASATTQQLLAPIPGLFVVWHGKHVSALPFRIRLLNQASPLAYSLDISRPAAYSDSWTGISLGRPAHPEDRTLATIGIANPLVAEAIARGDAPSSRSPVPATTYKELAARQVAIWSSTNNIPLTRRTVPDASLRQRAKQLLAGLKDLQVPLQAAYHSVQIFVRDTTANTVQLAVTIGLDPNTSSTTAQNIDLYLDGVRCPIRTQAQTHIELRSDGIYHADRPVRLDAATHSTDVAYVNLDRNTKVVDATATWVNVVSDPGLVMAGADAAPPLVTAEPAALNLTTTTELNPADYTNPEQLLNNVGTNFLTRLHGPWVWVVLLAGLYLITRAGRLVDTAAAALGRLARRKRKDTRQETVHPAKVEIEATTESEAIRCGLVALNLTTSEDVVITILQTPGTSSSGSATPARVQLIRRRPG